MSLDPKYVNLPWIAHGQPDLYETDDLPEADQHAHPVEELNSASVEGIVIKPDDAYKKFAGKKLATDDVDFSDSISATRKTGYHIETDEYEILAPDERANETAMQKYQRLQVELRQLMESVQHVSDQSKLDPDQPINAAQLSELTAGLQAQLADFHLEQVIGPEAQVDLTDPQGSLRKRVFQHIDSFKPAKASPKKGEKQSVGDSSHILYEMVYQPEHARNVEQTKLLDLDQRIVRLEALLGNDPSKVSALTVDTAQRGLLEAVNRLTARSSLLEPGHLDQIEIRLSALQTKLQGVTEKREQTIADADTQNKIAELYELVKKWDSMADTVPALVDRLMALKELHEQAMQFSQTMSHLDMSQQQVANAIKLNGDLLKQMQQSLRDSMEVITANVDKVEDRLQKCGK